jgi:glycosyltransferase involved in cell wall biosynthesis
MRLLFVVDLAYPDHAGGSHRMYYEVARRLAARGNDVHLVTAQPRDDVALPTEETIEGVHYHRFARDRRNALTHALSYIGGAWRIFDHLAAQAPFDLISAHYALPTLGVLSSPQSGRTPVVYTLHGAWAREYAVETGQADGAGPRAWLRRGVVAGTLGLMRLLEWLALRASMRVHVESQFMVQEARGFYGVPAGKLVLIPGGVDATRFAPTLPRAAARQKLGLPPDRPLLLTVRRLYARMGLENLVAAMVMVVREQPAALLLIGGAGPLEGRLREAVAVHGLGENVRLLGYVPEERLPLYYRAADLFVLPTVELEGFGLVTLEALACGTPVLGTPVGGTVEILSGLDPALLCRSPQPDDLAEGIGRLLADPALAPSAEACRRYVLEHYSWDDVAVRLEEVFAAVLEDADGRRNKEKIRVYPRASASRSKEQ